MTISRTGTMPPDAPQPDATPPTAPAPPAPPRRGPRTVGGVVWRLAAIAGVILAAFVVARLVTRTVADDPAPGDAPLPPVTSVPPGGEDVWDAGPKTPDPALRREAGRRWRRWFASIVLPGMRGAADDAELSLEERRRRIADRLGVAPDFPYGDLPADLLPEEAEVVMAVDDPQGGAARMVIVRMAMPPGEALRRFHVHYTEAPPDAKGDRWKALPAGPTAGPDGAEGAGESPAVAGTEDRGWLAQFQRDRAFRIVFAHPTRSDEESLVLVYDLPY